MNIDFTLSAKFGDLLTELRDVQTKMVTLALTNKTTQDNFRKEVKLSVEGIRQMESALEVTAGQVANFRTTTMNGEFAKTQAQVEATIGAVNILADQAVASAEKIIKGESKKELALRSQIIALKRVQDAAKNIQSPADALRIASQINAITKTVESLSQEIVAAGEKNDNTTNKMGSKFTSLKSLILQARAAAFQMGEQFGVDSPQAISAQRNLSNLEEKLSDLKKRTDALNPERKFAAISQLAQGVAGGFAAAQGALALFGEQSEDVNRAILKVQGALALSQGINSILEMGDAFKNLKALLGLTTVATVTETVAVEAHTVAMLEDAAATQIATVETESFTKALLTNPVFLIVAAIAALATAFILLGKDAAASTIAIDNFGRALDKIDEKNKRKDIINKNLIEQLEAQAQLIKTIGSTTADNIAKENAIRQRSLILKSSEAKLNSDLATFNDKINLEASRKILEAELKSKTERVKQLQQEKVRLGNEIDYDTSIAFAKLEEEHRKGIIDDKDFYAQKSKLFIKRKELISREGEIPAEIAAVNRDITQIQTQFQVEELNNLNEHNQRIIEAEKALRDELKLLATKEESARIDTLIGEEKLKAERDIQQREVTQLRDHLIELAQIQEDQKGTGKVITGLNPEQEAQINNLRLIANQKFQDELVKMQLENGRELADAMLVGLEKENALLENDIQQKVILWKQRGFTELQIADATRLAMIEGQKRISLSQIDLQAETSKAIIAQMDFAGDSEALAEKKRQLKILQVDKEAAEKRLEILFESITEKNDPALEGEIEKVRGQIKALEKAIKKGSSDISNSIEPINWAKLFGIDPALADQFNAQAEKIVESIMSITNTVIASELAQLEVRKQATDEMISQLDQQIQEKERAIEEDHQLTQKGVANNLTLHKRELEELKRQKQAALADEKRIAEEQKKLRQQQAVVDSIAQASSLLTAGAELFSHGAASGPIGIITAIATIAAMIASFLSLKSKVEQATKLEYGDTITIPDHRTDSGTVRGRRHSDRLGHRIEDTNIYVEDGEEVTNRRSSAKHRRLLKAINKDNFRELSTNDLAPILEQSGVMVSEQSVNEIHNNRIEHQQTQMVLNNSMDTKRLEMKVEKLNETANKMLKHISNNEIRETQADGSLKITKYKGSVEEVTIIRNS